MRGVTGSLPPGPFVRTLEAVVNLRLPSSLRQIDPSIDRPLDYRRTFLLKRLTRPLICGAATLAVAPILLSAGGASASTQPVTLRGTITVSAASSLTQAFQEIAAKFHKQHKNTTILFNFGSSATLATQIVSGAPADVYASADLTDMDTLVSAGLVRVAPTTFARNQMEIAVKPGNPSRVTGLASLASVGVVALCAATAPCGKYAANILGRANVTIPTSSITRQPNSQSTVQQVALGDANAALVYVTDVNSAGKAVRGVKIPAYQNTIAVYPIARLANSVNARLAQAFVSFVVSHAGQRTLHNQGFLAP
jgi:molybdate transport system substrate-binding protein